MGFFSGPLFDFNGDGKADDFETFVGLQMMSTSREEAIALTGDDTFFMENRMAAVEEDDIEDELEMNGLDYDDLAEMSADERREALEDAGLDPDDFEDEF